MCLLVLGPAGGGKTLLVKRLQKLTSGETKGDLGDPPPTQPTVGTNLTDLVVQRKMVVRELGGRMAPIWPSYYGSARAVMFVIDASDPTQLSSSCAQLLSVLSAEQLATAPVLVLFNKMRWRACSASRTSSPPPAGPSPPPASAPGTAPA
ncbi:ADP-ribosylation factor-like protein 16 isoform X4 [Ornithorhynchus anatinus]|uniref:ADP-ribosylation factor-like protein 16 isoform X4 n=1 Tax=Ornithorhynchus anatinus TaxID=9258 RepID=UPI0010A7D879|nr:ADP-ribosylation factor-like protein 16 isoform X4 [Ornithorhynchus anatinus]